MHDGIIRTFEMVHLLRQESRNFKSILDVGGHNESHVAFFPSKKSANRRRNLRSFPDLRHPAVQRGPRRPRARAGDVPVQGGRARCRRNAPRAGEIARLSGGHPPEQGELPLLHVCEGETGERERPGPFDPACIRRDDHEVFIKVSAHIFKKHRGSEEIIHRNIKKPLNLAGMEIHGDDPIRAGNR